MFLQVSVILFGGGRGYPVPFLERGRVMDRYRTSPKYIMDGGRWSVLPHYVNRRLSCFT